MAKRNRKTEPVRSEETAASVSAQTTHNALEDLDRVFHEKARLGILTTIVGCQDGMNFNELKQLCRLTDGNLNRHLKVLVDSGILSVRKSGQGRNTNSLYKLTARGRRAFERYLNALETILSAAKQSSGDAETGRNRGGEGLSPAVG